MWLNGDFGELYVMSMYCRYGYDIEPYLTYVDRVKGRGRVIFSIDANAVFSSTRMEVAIGRMRYARGFWRNG